MEIGIIVDEEYLASVGPEWLDRAARRALELVKAPSNTEIGLVVTSAEEVARLSEEYLKDGLAHDVLTFAFSTEKKSDGEFILPPDGLSHLGEIIISYPQAAVQAKEHNHSIRTEILLLAIHGILHLLGYDHEEPDEEKKMRAREAEILKQIEVELA